MTYRTPYEVTWDAPLPPPPPGRMRPDPLSVRIENICASIPPLLDRLMAQAKALDTAEGWTASTVAAAALETAMSELTIASLSLGVDEARRS